MAGIDYVSYINSILPSYLQDDHAKAFMKAFCNEGEELFLEAQAARREGMIYECANDDVVYHFGNASLLQSPFETVDQQRAYLEKKFDTWKTGGSVSLMKSELARFGYKNTKVVTWSDLIKMGVKDPFGGGFTKIVGLNINGGMTYFPKRKDVTVVVEHRIQGPSQPLVIETDLSGRTLTVVIKLATDIGGFPISTPLQIEKALNFRKIGAFFPSPTLPTPPSATDNLSDYLGYGHLGTGAAAAVISAPVTLKHGYHSFFFLDIEEPNGFTGPILWNDNTVTYTSYKDGLPLKKWRNVTPPTLNPGETLSAIWANSLENIWVGTDSGRIFRWNGSTWINIPTGITDIIYDIWGSSSSAIWVVSSSTNALFWNGTTFTTYALPASPSSEYYKIWGGDDNNVWAVSDEAVIVYWDGTSWTKQLDLSGTGQSLKWIHGSSFSDIWAVGEGPLVVHYDGTSWSTVPNSFPVNTDLSSVFALQPNNVWIGGSFPGNNSIAFYDGSSLSLQAVQEAQNPPLGDAVFTSMIIGVGENEVFAFNGGENSSGYPTFPICYFDGTQWRSGTQPTPNYSALITAVNCCKLEVDGETYLFAVGSDNNLDPFMIRYSSQKTGLWNTVYEFTSEGPLNNCIFGTGDNDIWVSDKTKMHHYNGTSWTTYPLPITIVGAHKRGQATSTTDAWLLVDKNGIGSHSILHWNGTSWTEVLTSAPEVSLWANSSTDVWAGGGSGVLKHWNGMTWNTVTLPVGFTTCQIYSLWGTATTLFVPLYNATNGYLFQYDGATWTNVTSFNPARMIIGAVGGLNSEQVFVQAQRTSMLVKDLFAFVDLSSPHSLTAPYNSYLERMNNPYSTINTIYPLSINSVWFADSRYIYYWNGYNLEDLTTLTAGWTRSSDIFVVGENNVYYVESFSGPKLRVRRFSPTTVTRPSGATGKLWNNGHYWDGTPPYKDALKDIRRIVRKFKPVSTSGRFARIFFNKKTFVYPIGESYEEDAYGDVQGPYLSSYLVE